jgi:hypothetical protein
LYPWVNDIPGNPLADYKSLEVCDRYFSRTVDPNRGRPIVVGKPFILAGHTKRINIPQILQPTNVMKITQGGIDTTGALITNGPNPLGVIGMTVDQIAVSRLLETEMMSELSLTASQAQEIWFYGDIPKALKYVENWPVQVVQAPVNSEAEFNQDIIMRWKASKRGRCVIAEPRVIQRCNFLNESTSGT